MTDDPHTRTHPRLDDRGRLLDHVPCVHCRYDLHRTSVGASHSTTVCPECGRPVADSLSPQRLVFVDARWLGTVRRGLDIIIGGLALGAVMFVVLVVVEATVLGRITSPWPEVFVWVMAMPPGLVIAFGIWRLTSPEPGGEETGLSASRRVARVAAISATGMALATAPEFVIVFHEDPAGADLVAMLFIGVGFLACIVFGFAALLYAASLAWRMPDRRLVRFVAVAIAGWLGALAGPIIGAANLAGLAALDGVAGRSDSVVVSTLGILLGAAMALGFVCYVIWMFLTCVGTLGLTLLCRSRLRAAERWAAENAG